MVKVRNKFGSLSDKFATIRKERDKSRKTISPFEVHVNKDKHKVLGKKLKVDSNHGLPGITRSKAIAKRKSTLLLEYKVKDKDNIFLDRRIGEKNSGMSQEDKAMARFAAERVKAHSKKNIFNLNDEEVLTHRGQSLMDIEKYEDPRSDEDDFSDDDNKTGKLDKKFVEDAHFGGGVLSKPNSEMSRKDIIDKLIAESKKRKAERQKLREQTIDLTEKLDTEWRDLLPLVTSNKKTDEESVGKAKINAYDRAMRELKFEARGVPSDKLKSEEEIASEEKIRLEKLEADRLSRMKGFSDESEFQKNHRSADDLDDFKIEEITAEPSDDEEDGRKSILKNIQELRKPNGANDQGNVCKEICDTSEGMVEVDQTTSEQLSANNEDAESDKSSEASEDSEDNFSDLKASESSDEENEEMQANPKSVKVDVVGSNDNVLKIQTDSGQKKVEDSSSNKAILNVTEDEIEESLRDARADACSKEREAILEKARQELPNTFEAPKSFDDLVKLFKGRNPDHQAVIVERLIKCYHWRLGEKNKGILLSLFSFLLQYLEKSLNTSSPKKLVETFQLFDRLCPHFYDIAHASPFETKTCLHDILKEKHDTYEGTRKIYPELYILILFKLVSILYPTSDFRHPIVTPCLVFMSQILLRCKIKDKRDISKGLFICTLILEYNLLSKRWSPSVINYLRGVIYVSMPKPFSKVIKVVPPFKSVGETSNMLVLEDNHKRSSADPLLLKMQVADFLPGEIDDDFRIRTFSTAVSLLCEFQQLWNEPEAAFSIFEPILVLLNHGSLKRYPKKIKEKVLVLVDDLKKLKERKLEYLAVEKKKPTGIKMYEPRIEAVYDGKRNRNMSKVKAEREKLIHKLKKETKSAIREIRKDNAFLSKVKIKQQIASDAERKRKVKEIYGEAAVQQSEFKKLKKK
ncbi:hypothetical protein QAD02_018797 [Eretmocerus hayati]|uniref:Uncharacterized protein n=1 Tax=Eretmocerus hayati TaxID=131215 RepID=A0ACC2PHD3_9HYME|nr:hypothetical protein QAD02_018797 [Eretmocerus hayati]